MKHLRWAKSTTKGLIRVRKFLAKENPDAAKRAAEAILKYLSLLSHHSISPIMIFILHPRL